MTCAVPGPLSLSCFCQCHLSCRRRLHAGWFGPVAIGRYRAVTPDNEPRKKHELTWADSTHAGALSGTSGHRSSVPGDYHRDC